MGPSLARSFLGIGALLALAGGAACNTITGADALQFESDDGGEETEGDSSSPGDPTGQGLSGPGAGSGGAGDTGGSGPGETPGPACGDGACNGPESCATCPGDCGPCDPCGDGTCAGGETCDSCAADCGACDPCGNGVCDAGETCETCASDCGGCSMCAGAGDATTPLDGEEEAFLVLINQYRADNGLGPLAACTSLNRAAQGHSEDMRDKNYFAHQGLNGSSPWDRACDACYALGCGPATAMAENIAAGNSGAQATFTQWKNSPGHNANMLGPNFTMIGIGRATGGGQYGVYWTNVFGGDDEPSCN